MPVPGGSVSFATSQDGGFSLAQGLTLNFTASVASCAKVTTADPLATCTPWWVPQTIKFAVDNLAQAIPTSGDIQNSAQVTCVPAGPPPPNPPPCLAPDSAADDRRHSQELAERRHEREHDPRRVCDADGDQRHLQGGPPSPTLPEGLRGESLKITGGDTEAAGQIRLVLGSYAENLHVTGPRGHSPSASARQRRRLSPARLLSIQGATRLAPRRRQARPYVQGATASDFQLQLLGTLYLTNDVQFGRSAAGATVLIDTRRSS